MLTRSNARKQRPNLNLISATRLSNYAKNDMILDYLDKLDENGKKLDENLVALSVVVNADIDKKWMEGEFHFFTDYIQGLINEVGELKQIIENPTINIPTINLDGTCISPTANNTVVGYDEAFILIFQELCNIKSKLSNTSNSIYLPNV